MNEREAREVADEAAEAVRALNHVLLAGGLDVTDVYDTLTALAVLAARLPQTAGQAAALVDRLVAGGHVVIVDGEHTGNPETAAAQARLRLAAAARAATALARHLDEAAQGLAWATHHEPR